MGQERERDVKGFHDPRLRLSVNLYGAPALSFEEFAAYKQDLIIGISLAVTPPLGQYDSATGATVYTENGDFLGRTREQAPLYSFQANVVYDIGWGIWGAATVTYLTGGRTTVDGRQSDDRQDNLRVGGTVVLPVNRHNSVKVYGATGAVTRSGGEFDVIGILWQYRWGAGF